MPSKNRFTLNGNEIHIFRENWPQIAMTTYREDYYEELTSVTWTENNGYLVNGKFGKLHRYIMAKWYGEEMLEAMTQQGWVVDHMNNNGFDCRISNLEFLAANHNVAKGQVLDVDTKRLRMRIALTLCKDFSTGYYQIHIGCNDRISFVNTATGEARDLAKLKLLYDCDYRIVLNDAERILLDYELTGIVPVSELKCIDYKPEYFENITLKEEEKGRMIIERDGKKYFVMGNGIWFHSSAVDEGWVPQQK